jgi:hypothetical protein
VLAVLVVGHRAVVGRWLLVASAHVGNLRRLDASPAGKTGAGFGQG